MNGLQFQFNFQYKEGTKLASEQATAPVSPSSLLKDLPKPVRWTFQPPFNKMNVGKDGTSFEFTKFNVEASPQDLIKDMIKFHKEVFWIAIYLIFSGEGLKPKFLTKEPLKGISYLIWNSCVHGDSAFQLYELMQDKQLKMIFDEQKNDFSQNFWLNLAVQNGSAAAKEMMIDQMMENEEIQKLFNEKERKFQNFIDQKKNQIC